MCDYSMQPHFLPTSKPKKETPGNPLLQRRTALYVSHHSRAGAEAHFFFPMSNIAGARREPPACAHESNIPNPAARIVGNSTSLQRCRISAASPLCRQPWQPAKPRKLMQYSDRQIAIILDRRFYAAIRTSSQYKLQFDRFHKTRARTLTQHSSRSIHGYV